MKTLLPGRLDSSSVSETPEHEAPQFQKEEEPSREGANPLNAGLIPCLQVGQDLFSSVLGEDGSRQRPEPRRD
jgi:hypothetical protein